MDDKSIPADISAIKEAIKIKEREFWEEIKKGQFTGNMMFLREIEKSVGPGSLRILASVDKENYKEYIDYFLLPTSEEELQKKLAAEILKKLPEREQEAYWNHVEKMTKKDESL
jgi:DNA-directed RNA polymerase specialized sigma subunit